MIINQLFWEVPYIEDGKIKTIIKQAAHRRGAERSVVNHTGTAVECTPPAKKKTRKSKA